MDAQKLDQYLKEIGYLTARSHLGKYKEISDLLKDYDPLKAGIDRKSQLLDDIWKIVSSEDKEI